MFACLNANLGFIMFVCFSFLTELLRNIRTQVLIKLIKPYTRIHIPFISKVLAIEILHLLK